MPYIEAHGCGEKGTKRTGVFYNIHEPHRSEKVREFLKKHKIDRYEIPASLTHVLQGVDQIASSIKAMISNSWCVFMQNAINKRIFHEQNYKPPAKSDLITWTEEAWESISGKHLEAIAKKCYMSPHDLDDDMAVYGPLHGGEDIISEHFLFRPQHTGPLEEDLPEYDPFEKW